MSKKWGCVRAQKLAQQGSPHQAKEHEDPTAATHGQQHSKPCTWTITTTAIQYITPPTRSQQLGSTRPHVSSLIAPTPAPWALRPKTTPRPPRPQKHTVCVATPQKNGAKFAPRQKHAVKTSSVVEGGFSTANARLYLYTAKLFTSSRPWSEQHHEE